MQQRLRQAVRHGRHLAVAVFILAILLYPTMTFAHAHLVRSQPEANSTLKQAPKIIELWFNEELSPNFNAIAVTDQSGKRVDKNNVSLSEEGKKLQIDLADLSSGTYTVDWKNLSADQHTMKGKFTFTVALAESAASTTTPAPQPSAVQKTGSTQPTSTPRSATATGSEEQSGSTWALSAVRWLEYLGLMTLFGGFTFLLLVLAPALRQAQGMNDGQRAAAIKASAGRFITLSWLSLGLVAFAAVLGLVLQASAVMDMTLGQALSVANLYKILTMTSYGVPWLLQIVALIVLALIVLLLSRRTDWQKRSPALMWIGLVVSAVLFLTPSLTGHAAAAASEHRFAVFTDWLHLVAGGVWIGGLFHLTLSMPQALSAFNRNQRLRVLHLIIQTFTRLAITSTILIVLTGIYNSWMHVESFPALWNTAYGKTLLLKVILFLPMIALGGLNTFVLHPRAKALIERDDNVSTPQHSTIARNFYRSVATEAALGVVVLLVAAVLVFLQPARMHPMMSEVKYPKSTFISK